MHVIIHVTNFIVPPAFQETEITLPVVLYGCETWSLALKEEQRLRVFGNKLLRNIFGAKRGKVTEKR